MKTIDQPAHQAGPARYDWFVVGDINGFFGLAFDNFTVLSFPRRILIFGFQFPADIVYKRMFPRHGVWCLVGDLILRGWLSVWRSEQGSHGNCDASRLDTPSTIGLALTVLVRHSSRSKRKAWRRRTPR